VNFPGITVTFDDGRTATVTPSRVDLLRLERIDKVSSARMFDEPTMDSIYRLAWLPLQRTKTRGVDPFKDLGALSRDELNAGVDGLAELAEITVGAEAGDGPKASDPEAPTGE
jgi:hypothetical protein